ncbi:hypothetical protein VSR69_45975, partial [Paraburkholderia phytofirmans]
MPNSTPSSLNEEQLENGSQHLPGFELTHTFHVVSVCSLDVVARVATHLRSREERLIRFAVARSGDIFEQKIVLKGIGEGKAKLLREQLLTVAGVLRIRLEHVFLRSIGPPINHDIT